MKAGDRIEIDGKVYENCDIEDYDALRCEDCPFGKIDVGLCERDEDFCLKPIRD